MHPAQEALRIVSMPYLTGWWRHRVSAAALLLLLVPQEPRTTAAAAAAAATAATAPAYSPAWPSTTCRQWQAGMRSVKWGTMKLWR